MHAVIATDLSKTYRLYPRPLDRLLEPLSRRPRHVAFPALDGVTFNVEKGETIGLVGRNGAGKSTLLKLLCGVTQPTSGTVEVRGKIASILELGTGFHPEFTGRDNAALNAAILGLTPEESRLHLPEMLRFSELGEFLDRPVKTYSSGMYMRLAFSVAVHVDPDVLIVDEALAVGDGHFQRKCLEKMRELQLRGTTVFFCSHALYFVSSLCRRTIWLEGGRVRTIGRSSDVIPQYERFLEEQNGGTNPVESEAGVSAVRIAGLTLLNPDGQAGREFSTGDTLTARIEVASNDPSHAIHLLVSVVRESDELPCFIAATKQDGLDPLTGRERYEVDLTFETLPLLGGDYRVIVFAGDEYAIHVYDRRDFRSAFTIRNETYGKGVVAVDHVWA